MCAVQGKVEKRLYGLDNFYYRRLNDTSGSNDSLYGLDNFYYRRFDGLSFRKMYVYTDLIISTIVDMLSCRIVLSMSIRT